MDRNIKIEIKDRIAYLVGNPKIICGNNDYSVTFTFDDEWTGVDVKTLRVSYNGKYSDHVFSGDTVELPPIIKAVEVFLGVFAGDITSTKVAVRSEPSILCAGGSVADPEPDVYAQIIDLLNSREPSGGGIAKETDPTVPAWAKQPNPPTYTAQDVGARPADWLPTPAEIGAQPAGNYALKSEIPAVPVQSVNGKTGDVKLNAADVGAASEEELARLNEEIVEQLDGKQPKGDYVLKSEIPAPYTLPTASSTVKGGVMIGEGLQMDGDVLSVVGGGSEGEYELIEEFTLKENAAVSRTQEPDGTAYSFAALYIKLTTNAVAANGSNIYFAFDGSTVWRPIWLDGVSNNNGGSTYVAQIEARKVHGDYVYEKLSYANNLYVRAAQKTPYLDIGDKTITGFSIESPVTAETTITIKGVRA